MKLMKYGLVLCGLQVLSIVTSGAKIKLFRDADSSDLFWELNVTDNECVKFPVDKYQDLRSIITDTCFIAYVHNHCIPKMSYKYLPGKTLIHQKNVGYSVSSGWMASLHLCNDQEGGPQLNVDLTTFLDRQNSKTVPNILESYDNVCSCVNIPKYVQDTRRWSMDNHGNSLLAYFEPDCKETNWYARSLYIEAGRWYESWEMDSHTRSHRGTAYKIMSFGPDLNSTYFQLSCSANRHENIMKLELLENLNSSSPQVNANLNDMKIDLTTGANDDVLHFFADNAFQGYHFGSRSTSKCNNFPKPVQRSWPNGIGSIKTKTCVILFSELDCRERSVKIEVPGTTNLTSVWESTVTGGRTLSLLYTRYPNWNWETKSYRVCNKDEGGSNLKVDILSSDPSVEPKDGPVILESYPNLCSCRNVPEYVQRLDKWFVNNHGNEMMAYFSPDCSSTTYSPLRIPAGQSSYSFGLGSFKNVDSNNGSIHKIQSFGPDLNARYFHRNCNSNSTTLSTFGLGSATRLNTGSLYDSDGTNESTLLGLLIVDRMEALLNEFQHISWKVNELKQINQQTGFNIENAKSFFEEKLQRQNDEFKSLQNKMKDDLQELFA